MEVGDFDKYTIKIDGSRRLTNGNRRFLQPVRPNKEAISRRTTSGKQHSATTNPVPAQTIKEGPQEGPGSYHRPPPCPSVGAKFCRAAEGGAEPPVEPPHSLNRINLQLACNHGQVGQESSELEQGAGEPSKSPD